MIPAAVSGFQLALALILVIGPQNAFVLRQGLRREHVTAVVLFCAASDSLLMGLGIGGLSAAAAASPVLQTALRWGGAAFLSFYGLRSFVSAARGGGTLEPGVAGTASLRSVLGTVAVLTWANPHVWLDTVVLVGSVAAQHPGHATAFWAGASAGSATFFAALGYGARALRPVFSRPAAWRLLDTFVGALMWTVAAGLIFF